FCRIIAASTPFFLSNAWKATIRHAISLAGTVCKWFPPICSVYSRSRGSSVRAPLPQQKSKRYENARPDGKNIKGIIEREHAGLTQDLLVEESKSCRRSGRRMIHLKKIVRPLIRRLECGIVGCNVF